MEYSQSLAYTMGVLSTVLLEFYNDITRKFMGLIHSKGLRKIGKLMSLKAY